MNGKKGSNVCEIVAGEGRAAMERGGDKGVVVGRRSSVLPFYFYRVFDYDFFFVPFPGRTSDLDRRRNLQVLTQAAPAPTSSYASDVYTYFPLHPTSHDSSEPR